jgi:DNA polymerase-1
MLGATEITAFDCETTRIPDGGGWPERVHVICARELHKGVNHVFGPGRIEEGVRWLEQQPVLIAHNGLGFDVPVLEHHYNFDISNLKFFDTMVLTRLFFSEIGKSKKCESEWRRYRHTEHLPSNDPYKFTSDMVGAHSLEAWGLRLTPPRPKGTYAHDMELTGVDPWAEWNQAMQDYCELDVDLLCELWRTRLEPRMLHQNASSIAIEHYMQSLMLQLKQTGIKFKTQEAVALANDIEAQQVEFLAKIQEDFPPRLEPVKWTYTPVHQPLFGLMAKHPGNPVYRPRMGPLPEGYQREMWGEEFVPKVSRVVNQKVNGVMTPMYNAEKGCPYVKCQFTEFNINSAPQRQRRLMELGWMPTEFSDADNPVTDEPNLLKIEEEIPAARSIVNYLAAQKRLGMLKTGDKAWLNLVDKNDFIHPTILPCSTVTFRAIHIDPNISQVPSIRKDKETQQPLMGLAGKWNYECRSFFTVPEGFEMVGADLSGLELRCWAHYLAPFDNGRMIERLLHEDVHEDNRIMLNLADRRKAKEWLFALIYGGGDEQLGYIVDPTASVSAQIARGQMDRAIFMRNVEGMSDLMGWIRPRARRGWLAGLDGRRIPIRSPHSALNAMLQSAGAIISKYWIMYAIEMLENDYDFKWGYGPEDDYALLIYSHDEFDFAVREGKGTIVEEVCMLTAETAGKALGMRIPIAAEVHPGPKWRQENPGQYMRTWAEVH